MMTMQKRMNIQTIITVAMILTGFAAAWGAFKQEVKEIKAEQDRRAPYVERFIQLEARDELLIEDVTKIKNDIELIKSALRIK